MKEQLQLLLCGLAARALGVGASPIENAHKHFVLDVMTKMLLSRYSYVYVCVCVLMHVCAYLVCNIGASPIENAHKHFVLDVMTKMLLSRLFVCMSVCMGVFAYACVHIHTCTYKHV
jgi:hypothetical protein